MDSVEREHLTRLLAELEDRSSKEAVPDRILLYRQGCDAVIDHFMTPTSMPQMKCETSKKHGGGHYQISFMGKIKTFTVVETDNSCPWVGHCPKP